jgi:hypothetical protein
MKSSNHRVFAIKFASVYPLYVQKAERKNRTKAEVDQIIRWLTGYTQAGLRRQIEKETDLQTFFAQAPAMHPNSSLIKGVVCGVRVEDIEDPLMKKIRYLDKLIDELAKGKKMETILRQSGGTRAAVIAVCLIGAAMSFAPRVSEAQHSPDAQVITQLRQAGSNLRKPHQIEFFLYLPSQLAAERVAEKVRALDFTTKIERAATGSDWLLVATKKMIPTESKLAELRETFSAMVLAEQGEYDGWVSTVVK